MTQTLSHSPSVMDPELISLGKVYAQALDGLVDDINLAKDLCAELGELVEILHSIPGAMTILTVRTITKDDREKLIERIFSGRTTELVSGLLGILARHGRMALLPAVVRAFETLLARRLKKIDVKVFSAIELDDAMLDEIRRDLSESLDANVSLTSAVDCKMLGGLILQIGDKVYDSAVSTRLDHLLKQILKQRIQ